MNIADIPFSSIWVQVKSIWQPISSVASVISSTGFVAYFTKELAKRYQKPELTCAIVINNSKISKIGTTQQDAYGYGTAFIPDGTSELLQECSFTISNLSDYTAIKFRLVNKEHINWEFPLESTSILKGYEKEVINVKLRCVARDEIINNLKAVPIKEIVIEYRNIKGKKYLLYFKPSEPDFDKRNTCKAA